MKPNALMYKFCLLLLAFAALVGSAVAQKAPRQEKLLNGLKILMWSEPAADKVSVKIRVHSGSAFDPQGKEGLMYLLAQNFFPNEPSREFFSEDLGGNLEIISNYDYIQINATSNPASMLQMLDTLAQVVTNPTIDKETTDSIKAALAAKLDALEKDPAYVADQAVAKRLFGKFPYGRPQMGTKESISKIDFADLRFAKDRFFGADNATIAISGNFNSDLAFKATRRYFGAWLKSDKRVPSTFEQPGEPDTKLAGVTIPDGNGDSQVRYALRGLGRSDRNYFAGEIVAKILNSRLKGFLPSARTGNSFVRNEARILPGIVVFGYSSGPAPIMAAPVSSSGTGSRPAGLPDNVASLLLSGTISNEEYSAAKSEVSSEFNAKAVADRWLDVDTYKLTAIEEAEKNLDPITLSDVQRVENELAKRPVVIISVMANTNKPS
ncbi:MAG TPA: pitrilysin family protein [Pyrinomonadaceae bacterium]|nr:pitrilysin family protein [Pyrinomonadaceae bacterium]